VLEYTHLCIFVPLTTDVRSCFQMKINGKLCMVRMEEEVIVKIQMKSWNGGWDNSLSKGSSSVGQGNILSSKSECGSDSNSVFGIFRKDKINFTAFVPQDEASTMKVIGKGLPKATSSESSTTIIRKLNVEK